MNKNAKTIWHSELWTTCIDVGATYNGLEISAQVTSLNASITIHILEHEDRMNISIYTYSLKN